MYQPLDIKDTKYRYGFILPNGDFYACRYSGHNDLLYSMQEHGMIPEFAEYYSYAEDNGWLKLTDAMMTPCEFVFDFNKCETVENKIPLDFDKYEAGEYGGGYFEVDRKKQEAFKIEKKKIETPRCMTQAQIDAITDYAIARDKAIINFNYNYYKLNDLLQCLEGGSWNYDIDFSKRIKRDDYKKYDLL